MMRSLNQNDFRLRHFVDCSAHRLTAHINHFMFQEQPEEILSLFLYNTVLIQQQGEKERKKFQAKYYVAPISSVIKETAMGRNTSKKDSVPAR